MFSNDIRCLRIVDNCRGGRVAQLGEHLLCKQGVGGSNPLTSTNFVLDFQGFGGFISASIKVYFVLRRAARFFIEAALTLTGYWNS